MIFTEKKENDLWIYNCEDFIGEVTLKSKLQLSPNVLDSCVLRLTNMSAVSGTFLDDSRNNEIQFEFKKRPVWEEDELLDNK